MSVIWGLPYLLIKVAVTDLAPPVVVFSRVLLAAAVLLPIAIARGQLRQLRGHMRWVIAFAVIEMTIPWLLLTFAETRLTSSLTGLLIAAVPILAAILAVLLHLDDRLTGTRLLGLAIGLSGVGALVGFDAGTENLTAVAALAVCAVGYAIGPIIVAEKLSEAPSLAVIAVSMAFNAAVYAPVAWLLRPTSPVPAPAIWSLVGLGVVCTALAFVLFFALIAEVGPARTTVITYLNPAVAVLLGVAVLGEPITPGILIGFPLVLIGSFLATRRTRIPVTVEP